MLPTVETENKRPAVRPSPASSLARSRTAIGVTAARTTLGAPKSSTAAISGSSRAPGSHVTTNSSTCWSSTGTSSTNVDPSRMTPTSSPAFGKRSASAPPTAYPTARPASTTPMSAPHTKSELPKNGASTRLAAISTPSRTAPLTKTAALIAAARTSTFPIADSLRQGITPRTSSSPRRRRTRRPRAGRG